jgi:acyl carrier protein
MGEVGEAIKNYVLEEFLPGEDPSELTESTPLNSTGILDSIATLSLVSFLEKRFSIQIEPHELDGDSFNNIANIEQLVTSKQ